MFIFEENHIKTDEHLSKISKLYRLTVVSSLGLQFILVQALVFIIYHFMFFILHFQFYLFPFLFFILCFGVLYFMVWGFTDGVPGQGIGFWFGIFASHFTVCGLMFSILGILCHVTQILFYVFSFTFCILDLTFFSLHFQFLFLFFF